MGTYHHSKVAIWTQVLWRCKFSRQQEANTTRRIRKDIEEEGKEGTSKTLLPEISVTSSEIQNDSSPDSCLPIAKKYIYIYEVM